MKETKTAEAILENHIMNIEGGWIGETHTSKCECELGTIINAMQEYAEQARREERERHSELVEMLKRVTEVYIKSYPVDVKIAIEYDLEHALAAARYGKEGE